MLNGTKNEYNPIKLIMVDAGHYILFKRSLKSDSYNNKSRFVFKFNQMNKLGN
jgi:hypothetical protein